MGGSRGRTEDPGGVPFFCQVFGDALTFTLPLPLPQPYHDASLCPASLPILLLLSPSCLLPILLALFSDFSANPFLYLQVNSRDPGRTDRSWLLRENKKWLPATSLRVHVPGRQYEKREVVSGAGKGERRPGEDGIFSHLRDRRGLEGYSFLACRLMVPPSLSMQFTFRRNPLQPRPPLLPSPPRLD
jgi:hypothetical protein